MISPAANIIYGSFLLIKFLIHFISICVYSSVLHYCIKRAIFEKQQRKKIFKKNIAEQEISAHILQ